MSNVSNLAPLASSFSLDPALITITNLRLRTFIGFNQEELSKQQDVVINAEIRYQASQACVADSEDLALNYKLITKAMIAHVEQGHFRLLEKLCADLLNLAMSEPRVINARITVDKPHALRFADSVSVTLSGTRNAD
ncbi:MULTISPECIES: dihydroneopterin triphosphate 2'-epimerase [unclassified Agarivorans]|uniref:dihydroneopterin triphosphate 2'-epimerase n=1 Tax=unclassified Agarivorans TaxID=2636026 RepID=UPI003D7E044C